MAQFKTAYLQRMIPLNVAVCGSAALKRGNLVKLSVNTSKVPCIEKVTTLSTATHIIALTDMTIGDGHVPTDRKDYKPTEDVAVTAETTAAATADNQKTVGLYPIWDKNDIILETGETA